LSFLKASIRKTQCFRNVFITSFTFFRTSCINRMIRVYIPYSFTNRKRTDLKLKQIHPMSPFLHCFGNLFSFINFYALYDLENIIFSIMPICIITQYMNRMILYWIHDNLWVHVKFEVLLLLINPSILSVFCILYNLSTMLLYVPNLMCTRA
jgi:hypothetical protein